MKRSLHNAQEGFGIVVVALLFTAFSVVAAAMLDRSSVKTDMTRQRQVEAQLSRLSVALAKYARYNAHRLPCPALPTIMPTDPTFGAAAYSVASTCYSSVPSGIQEFGVSNKLFYGMVPVRELIPYGISYSEAFDPWGARIMYVVHRDVTPGTSNAAVAAASDAQRPDVRDYLTGQQVVPGPDTVLISFGRDRRGARLRTGTGIPMGCNSISERRDENCDTPLTGDALFLRGPLLMGTETPANEYFDDTISSMRYTP